MNLNYKKDKPHDATFSSMLLNRRSLLCLGALAIAKPAISAPENRGYPDKPVRIVVPSAPGGSLDAVARIVAQGLSEIWQQTVYIENKPGANFAIGAAFVARSTPDGYTLLYCHDGLMTKNPALYSNLSYNPLTELTAVGKVTELSTYLLVRNDLPYKNLGEFLAAMKAQPRKFNHAAGGPSAVFISEYFKAATGVEYTDVPYKGAAPAITAVAAGECDFTFGDPGSASTMVAAKRIKILASSAPIRSKLEPSVSTIGDFVPNFDVSSWSGLVAPVKTPASIINKINEGLTLVAASSAAQKQMNSLGLEFSPTTPEQLQSRIRDDFKRWSVLIKSRNITVGQ